VPPPEIRRAGPSDWGAIKAICAETGRQGEPVDDEEREAFAEHWVGPYRELRPDWTMVAVVDKKVVGYLTGCPDTLAFEKERRRVFQPQPDSRELFPTEIRLKLWTENPAHLHMNVLSDFRGFGTGAALLRAFFDGLKKAGVPSAHVICGPAAAPFWERMAFRTAALVEAAPGVNLSALTRTVD
jgi:GNAT superfamily N-acetyltransferase